MKILTEHSLKHFNSFGIDVTANKFAEVFSEDELQQIISEINFSEENFFILGGGSNVLFTKDFDGTVIKNSIPGINILSENESILTIQAGAGVNWNELVKFSVNKNLGGIENLVLIPGSVGAAPIQNIGAYGQQLADSFVSLKGLFINTGEEKEFYKNDCNFSYRSSIFKEELKDKFIITSVTLQLNKNPKVNLTYQEVKKEVEVSGLANPSIKDVSNIVAKIRSGKLPDPAVIGNAGSFFKNPVVDFKKFEQLKNKFPEIIYFQLDENNFKIPAGWLIEKCGWKGKRIGNAGTYPKQALVVVNYGAASGDEILELAMRIKEIVEQKFGIILDEEVRII